MKPVNRTCAITGTFLGTHGPAVHLVGGYVGSSQHLSPEICSSLINVIGREKVMSVGMHSVSKNTLYIGRLKEAGNVDDISRTIYRSFRTHPRVGRFLMENLGVSQDKLNLWKEELEQGRSATSVTINPTVRRPMHFH